MESPQGPRPWFPKMFSKEVQKIFGGWDYSNFTRHSLSGFECVCIMFTLPFLGSKMFQTISYTLCPEKRWDWFFSCWRNDGPHQLTESGTFALSTIWLKMFSWFPIASNQRIKLEIKICQMVRVSQMTCMYLWTFGIATMIFPRQRSRYNYLP